jgi:hypothetical protein
LSADESSDGPESPKSDKGVSVSLSIHGEDEILEVGEEVLMPEIVKSDFMDSSHNDSVESVSLPEIPLFPAGVLVINGVVYPYVHEGKINCQFFRDYYGEGAWEFNDGVIIAHWKEDGKVCSGGLDEQDLAWLQENVVLQMNVDVSKLRMILL